MHYVQKGNTTYEHIIKPVESVCVRLTSSVYKTAQHSSHTMYVYAYIINQMLTTTFDTCIVHSCLTYMLLGQAQHLLCTIAGRHFTAPRHWAHLRSALRLPLHYEQAPLADRCNSLMSWHDERRCGAVRKAIVRPFRVRGHSRHVTTRQSSGTIGRAPRGFWLVHHLRADAGVP